MPGSDDSLSNSPRLRRKLIAGLLILLGLAFLAGSAYLAFTPKAQEESGSYLKIVGIIFGFLLGAGANIKGWRDLFKKDASSITQTASAMDQSQAAVGDHAQAIKAETVYTGPVTQVIQSVPEPPSLGPRLHQLPPPPLDFTGRKDEIDLILADFDQHQGTAISGLTGLGGIGKTALGLVLAHRLAGRYCDAQIFLDLKGTTAPLSPLEILKHVILCFEPATDVRGLDEQAARDTYCSLLHGKKVLVFLDNARSADQVVPLIPGETSALLVTSRWSFSVPGLVARRVDVLSPQDAGDLLLRLCPRIGDASIDLALACGKLPLALRIAGSFLELNRARSVDQYMQELHDRKRRLAALEGARRASGLSAAEPDVEAALDLSYRQLEEDRRAHWRRLGVFPAPFTRQAAASVWELEEGPAQELLDLFCRYSLLDYDDKNGRYELHDLLADFAQGQLAQDEEQAARLRHAQHYLEVLSAADDLYMKGGADALRGLQLFDAEWPHVRMGQAWAGENADRLPGAMRVCADYPDAGAYCLSLRLHPHQQIAWLEAALSANKALGDRRGEGQDLGNLGNAYADLGEARKAIEFYEQALVILREIGNRRGEGGALGNLGSAYADLGDTRKAIEFYEQHLVIAREVGDRQGEANSLFNAALALNGLGETSRARELGQAALEIFTAIESPHAAGVKEWLAGLENAPPGR